MNGTARRRVVTDETGSVLIVMALALVMMLVMVAFVVDIGKAYLVQRQLQAAVDSAALAGAQHLPDATEAAQVANEYSAAPGMKNIVRTGDVADTTVTMRCVRSAPGCSTAFNTYNALNVKSASDVPMTFARVIGIDKLTVRAQATACSPCTSKPLDIMIVLDRTGSMCQLSDGSNDPSCTDLNNAKNGIRTFLSYMDPTLDSVGLAVFPPARDRSDLCATPTNSNKRYGYDAYWPWWIPDPRFSDPGIYAIGSLVQDYLTPSSGGYVLNPSSSLNQLLACTAGAGSTSYSNAIEEAQHELNLHGRGGIQDVIVFLSDGAANTTPRYMPAYMDEPSARSRPCDAGVRAAANAKASGTIVYTIGYDLNGFGTDPETCKLYPGGEVDSSMTAYDAIRAIASEPDNFYNKPDPGQLNVIFTRIAADLAKPAARLMDDDAS